MKIGVVIPVLYSPKSLLYQDAVKSIKKSWKKAGQSLKDLKIVVVLNNYGEKEKSLLVEKKGGVNLLKNRINRGFTGAVNDGVFFVFNVEQVDWSLVINDDTIVDDNFFAEILPKLKNNLAVVSCGVRDTDGKIQSLGMNYFKTGLTSPLTKNFRTDYFVGTAFFVSRKTFLWSLDNFGFLLAEFFFAYAEDLELSIRLKRANKKVLIFRKNLLTHLGSITAKRGSEKQLFWGYRNLLFITLIHWSLLEIIIFLPLLIFGQVYSLAVLLKKGHFLVYPKIIWSVIKHLPLIISYRRMVKRSI